MTAVELMHSEYKRILGNILVNPSQGIEIADAFNQAKELEKQQIIEACYFAYNEGCSYMSDGKTEFDSFEQYYTETYDK